jgi:hypothetical protein
VQDSQGLIIRSGFGDCGDVRARKIPHLDRECISRKLELHDLNFDVGPFESCLLEFHQFVGSFPFGAHVFPIISLTMHMFIGQPVRRDDICRVLKSRKQRD